MTRLMSVAMTTPQVRAREKWVTRRIGWWKLTRGTELVLIEKGQGLKKGEKAVRIVRVKVVSARTEKLGRMALDERYGRKEAILEGFPELDGPGFIQMFCGKGRKWRNRRGVLVPVTPTTPVRRVQWVYLEGAPLQ